MKETMVIACVPVSEKARRGIPYFKDPASKGYTVARCNECNEDVWLGPKSKVMCDAHGLTILCVECSIVHHQKESPGKPLNLKSFEELSGRQ